ncbi:MAG: hypothetical protein H7246_02775 [Phycisphaerae bacterium]|nr:hypothetical protein [Saprospiraceae bacterium]
MRKLIILFFLPNLLFSQNNPLDSLERVFTVEPSDLQKLELLSQMTGIAFGQDFKLALGYAKRGVALAEKTGDKDWQPKFYEMQGRMHANLSQLDSAMCFLTKRWPATQQWATKRARLLPISKLPGSTNADEK